MKLTQNAARAVCSRRSRRCALVVAGALSLLSAVAFAAGPYPPTDWPPTIDTTKKVHYGVVDGVFSPPNANWNPSLSILALNAGGDQNTVLSPCLAGFTGQKATTSYLNIADTAWPEWATNSQIDILLQVYGDTSVLNPTNYTMSRRVRFQLGTSASGYSTYVSPAVQSYVTNAYNLRWNWILFSVTNAWWTNNNDHLGYRQCGNIKPGSSPTSAVNGGINGGTVRLQCPDGLATGTSMAGFTIHAVAFGEAGAFGITNDINQFEPPDTNVLNCPPVPAVNLVGIDFNAGTSNHLQVMDQGDTTVAYLTAGPPADTRNAIVPTAFNGVNGYLLNFGIISNYLGYPCNPNEAVKVCVDFYDDPNFAGQNVQFGPEAYATDGQGCTGPAVFPASGLANLAGTGQWIHRAWVVGGATGLNLAGVNTAPLTGGPRLICVNQPVAVSQVEFGILRVGNEPLAGQDPLADCALDPLVCQGVYSNYVELDLAAGVTNGLDIGTSGGDQYMVLETSGPAADQRLSVRPSFGDIGPGAYIQFQIVSNALGSSYQDNAHLAVVATYYDDPALVGASFGIDAWRYHSLGQEVIFAADSTKYITLQGTGRWRDAYWEIDRIDFNGVNQSPQAAARFKCTAKVHVSRVRYAVIRTCGPNVGENLLDSYRVTSLAAGPETNGLVRLTWPYREPQLTVQGQSTLGGAWSTFMGTPIPGESEQAVIRLSPTNNSQFFRLYRPPIP